ncbi:YkvI family membrane protein [Neisseria animalis]|uniref:Membrane protein YkvI n=1 Tax=Neisseria animalis TaxID=492 RepID=A0A5P3MVN7_NEIAN|nr:hypothetical protein [Neisseria animalis]QEY24719.1 hypothetical protein D0T90_09805 [Neisseria animalis]ROW31687.1 hypothetical protein CGZ60_08920 [Neisseria animalis]VEE07867.1 Uncharacterized membrane protein [Neisseria animalis]
MIGKIIRIALAYVGVIVGAGLSSGQELMQYFVSFGKWGMAGIAVLFVMHTVFGRLIMMLGCYYQSNDHSEVLSKIAHPVANKVLDIALITSCFVIGFVMIAGAGANLNQQFGFPSWLGALVCALLIIGVSFLNFEKITQVIGVFTPIIIIMIIPIAAYTFIGKSYDFDYLDTVSRSIPTALPNIGVSVLNYFALCVMTGISMAFVLGGSVMRIGVAQKGGALGGALVGLISAVAALVLFANVGKVMHADIPMLTLAQEINPMFALAYAVVIFGLIFNTAFSLYYALAKRFAGGNIPKERTYMIVLVAIGFGLSFLGFKELVGMMYPVLGYLGILMLVILIAAWVREKRNMHREKIIRRRMIALQEKKYDDDQNFTESDSRRYQRLGKASVIDSKSIKEDIRDLVKEENQEQ